MTTRISALLFVFLLSAGASAQTVTFGEAAPLEGVTRTNTEAMDLDMDITASTDDGEQSMKMAQSERNTFTETIHSSVDGRIMRRTVVFAEAVKESVQPMRGTKKNEPPIIGITYEITVTDPEAPDQLEIVRVDGEAVAEEAKSFLSDKFDAHEKMRIDEILGGRTMSVGETLSLDGEDMKDFVTSFAAADMEVQTVTLTLNAVSETDRGEVAVLGITSTFTQTSPFMEMEITMDGTISIFTESLWLQKMELSGNILGAGSHAGSSVSAEGTVSMMRAETYE